MNGIKAFEKMCEIDKHVANDARWWEGEGLDLASIAHVLRAVANRLDPPRLETSWSEHWNAVRPRSHRAP